MDLILERFVAVAGDSLDEEELASLDRLLDHSDQDILDWIARRSPPPPDAGLGRLLERIRTASAPADAVR